MDLTDRLIQSGLLMGIELLDHLVITENSYESMVATGIFEELKQSTKYVPGYVLFDREVRRQKEKVIGTVASNMLSNNATADDIAKLFSITVPELEKILSQEN